MELRGRRRTKERHYKEGICKIKMKNTDCRIYLITKGGSRQTYCRDKNGWTQTSSKGIVRRMTAEQLLSHLLPPLTKEDKRGVKVRVEKINRKKMQ
jgi:hypothetical protein